MAAAVPYSPVPSVGPSGGQVSPYLRVPGGLEEAAGVGIGRAVQSLGQQVERVSDMAAGNVLALQNIQNETDAKNGDVDYTVRAGELQNQYEQLEGENRAKAYPEHVAKIKALRQEVLDGMPNPAARRMLDSAIARRTGYLIVDSSHKAATASRQASNQASVARVETAKATADFTALGNIELSRQTIEAEIDQQAEEHGWLPDTVKEMKRKEVSRMYLNSFQKLAPNDPEKAAQLFEGLKDRLDPNDRETIQTIVNRNVASHQTRIDAQEILKKEGFDPQKGPGQLPGLLQRAEKYKEKYSSNPDYADYLDNRVKSLFHTGMQGYKDQQSAYEYSIGKYILGQDDQNRIVNIDGIVGPNAPKEIRDAYSGLEPAAQRKVNNWVAQAAKGGAIGWTADGLRRYNVLKGMASDPETKEEFYNLGPEAILSENLPMSAKRELLNAQTQLKNKAGNVAVNKAMFAVEPMLNAAGITKSANKEDYFAFRGAFEDIIRDYQGEKKAFPPPEEIQKIASRLLQDQSNKAWFNPMRYLGGKDQIYRAAVPDEVRDQIVDEFLSKGMPQPTDEQIGRAYSYKLYKDLYGAPKAPVKSDSLGPTAPSSK